MTASTSSHTITEAETWEQIEAVTNLAETCIAPLGKRPYVGNNYNGAKKTWEEHRNRVRYFLIGQAGYARLIRTNASEWHYPTWILDFIKPADYEHIVRIAETVNGCLLVKDFSAKNQHVATNWSRITAVFSTMKELPYASQSGEEGTWLIVPGTLRPQTVSPTSPPNQYNC